MIANLDDFRARDVDLIVDEDGNITEKERAEVKTDRKDTHTVVSKLNPDKDAGTHSVHMTDEQIERERLLNMSEEYRKQKREEAEHEAKKRKRENTPELDNLEEQVRFYMLVECFISDNNETIIIFVYFIDWEAHFPQGRGGRTREEHRKERKEEREKAARNVVV